MRVIESGESFVALTSSLNDALHLLGGAPQTHRTDSLSAAYKNLSKDEQQDATQGYQEFCDHYGMKPTRNNRGVSHENGAIESPHGHLKQRIAQELMIRGSNDFDSVESYGRWLDSLISKLNYRRKDKVDEERAALTPLPPIRAVDYNEIVCPVSSTCTIIVRRVTYTVPSRLIGESLRVRVYERHLELFLGNKKTLELQRTFTVGGNSRARNIDFRHVIGSPIRDDLNH